MQDMALLAADCGLALRVFFARHGWLSMEVNLHGYVYCALCMVVVEILRLTSCAVVEVA